MSRHVAAYNFFDKKYEFLIAVALLPKLQYVATCRSLLFCMLVKENNKLRHVATYCNLGSRATAIKNSYFLSKKLYAATCRDIWSLSTQSHVNYNCSLPRPSP